MQVFGTPFRPFFLVGAAAATVTMGTWALVLGGHLTLSGPLSAVHWHAHEMLFGFTLAILTGFLLTAAQDWTKRTTVTGFPLAALVTLWGAGRVAGVLDLGVVGLALDVAFPLAVAAILARPLVLAGSRRNYAFIGLLVGLSGVDLAWHMGWLAQADAVRVVLDAMLLFIAIVGGRIVPIFTRNAVPDSGVRKVAWVDKTALGLTWALLLGDLASVWLELAPVVGILAGVAGLAHGFRMRTWGSAPTLRKPMLWILHLGYAWVVVSLLARGVVALGAPVSGSVSTHLLTVGGLGTFLLGMMSRVTLGHTGRRIVASGAMVGAYGLLSCAVIVRIGGLLWGITTALVPAALLFALAFGVYAVFSVGALTAPRPDGRSG